MGCLLAEMDIRLGSPLSELQGIGPESTNSEKELKENKKEERVATVRVTL